MQLISRLLVLVLFFTGATGLYSQENNSGKRHPIEVNFLLDYYRQAGDHSAVTGGNGTEQLHDSAPMIIVNLPIKSNQQLSLNLGVDVYSSASSDNIDPVVSGASSGDTRTHVNVGYRITNPNSTTTYGINVGASAEYDYRSFSFGANWAKSSLDGNRELNVSGQAFLDNLDLITPFELRPPEQQIHNEELSYPSTGRKTYNLSVTYSQVLSKRAQASINTDVVYQTGYLATPFHRVYFSGESLPRIERLPSTRFKLPVALRFNYYVNDFVITRFYYRYFRDDFKISANTFSVELPLRISRAISVKPFYRYHHQSRAKYFAKFGQHQPDDAYYTSDYDLAAFHSNKYGFGLRYYPLSVILGNKALGLKRVDLRFARYNRSDGLSAFTVSLGLTAIIY